MNFLRSGPSARDRLDGSKFVERVVVSEFFSLIVSS